MPSQQNKFGHETLTRRAPRVDERPRNRGSRRTSRVSDRKQREQQEESARHGVVAAQIGGRTERRRTVHAPLLDQQQPTNEPKKRWISRERRGEGKGKGSRLAHLSSSAALLLPPLLLGGEETSEGRVGSLLRRCRVACAAAADIQPGWQATEAACASVSDSPPLAAVRSRSDGP
jgi:hypothetical protein